MPKPDGPTIDACRAIREHRGHAIRLTLALQAGNVKIDLRPKEAVELAGRILAAANPSGRRLPVEIDPPDLAEDHTAEILRRMPSTAERLL